MAADLRIRLSRRETRAVSQAQAARGALHHGLRAALPAAVLSGVPSTLHAIVTGRDAIKASLAAGSIVIPRERGRGRLLIAAVPVHLGLSAAWAVTLTGMLPHRHPIGEGALAGLAIAALDLGIIGRRYPLVRELQPLPQIVDHVIFGIVVSVLASRSLDATR